jgi:putative toxin-antitoxin system antitoxin component (TIGR02293 family)
MAKNPNPRNTKAIKKNIVSEPHAAYTATPRTTPSNYSIFIAYKSESHMTPLEKMKVVHNGISKKDLERLKNKAALDYDQLAKIFSVARATLINKKGEEKFNTTISEKILSVADIYSYGYETFEDEEAFNRWMFRSNKALGGQSPYDVIDNQFGREEVKNLIGRIDYGVYS